MCDVVVCCGCVFMCVLWLNSVCVFWLCVCDVVGCVFVVVGCVCVLWLCVCVCVCDMIGWVCV